MTIVAGTIITINDGMPSYLVVNNDSEFKFLKVKYNKDETTTPLGHLLKVMKLDFVLDDLRLDELAIINMENQIGSLYVFNTVSEIQLPSDSPYKFVEASKLHALLEKVDMSSAPMFV